jgi:hypothetical protein
MKTLLAICMMIVSTVVLAGEKLPPIAPAPTVKGEVLEVINVESFTYLRLKTRDGETWAAIVKSEVNQGATVTLANVSVMSDFESKSLKRTFPTILFGTLASSEGGKSATHILGTAYPVFGKKTEGDNKKLDVAVKVPKAQGENAHTVAEIVTQVTELKDKPVRVSGKVVKYNANIMGKNWIHLRDGSGSAADNSDDILVTTTAQAKLGDTVTIKGIVRTDRDFGAGYVYNVLIEEATLE